MDGLTSVAAAGLRSRLEALDLLANNLANSSTAGFKADREAYTLYLSEESASSWPEASGYPQPTAPEIETHRTDFSQGQLSPTGSETDLALSGQGFFLVDGPSGAALLTRNGSFRVAGDGRLTTPDGYEFATVEPRRVRADPALPIQVDQDGTVRQQGQALGRLKLVDRAEEMQPAKREGAYFALDSRDLPKLRNSAANVLQGHRESANFTPAESSVKMITVLRQFEALQKAIQIGSEMGRKAVEEVARVSG